MKSLFLMRHGKSDWTADYDIDHDRPLNERGVRSARLIGRLLASRRRAPDVVLSSTAVRARSTAELAVGAGQWDSRLLLDESLYTQGLSIILDQAREHLDSERLMMVGHQPTWSLLVEELTSERVEMKTGSVATIEWPSGGTLAPGEGDLVELIVPRDLFGSSFDS